MIQCFAHFRNITNPSQPPFPHADVSLDLELAEPVPGLVGQLVELPPQARILVL